MDYACILGTVCMHMDCACILSLLLGTPKKLKSTRGKKMQAANMSQLCNVDMPKNCGPLSNRVFKVTFMCKRHHIVH